MPTPPKPLRLRPLNGSFDARSAPENVAQGTFRLLQNFRHLTERDITRSPGWKRAFDGLATHRSYNNEDLHDQLLTLQTYYDERDDVDGSDVSVYPPNNADFASYCGTTLHTRPQGRQPVTFLTEITSSRESRILLAGTQSRLYALNLHRGNWRLLADGLGGQQSNPQVRLTHAVMGDYAFFANDYDEPFYWAIDSGPTGCAMQAVKHIPELREIGVTRAAVVAAYKGTIFWMNVEQDGVRRSNRIIWSNYLSPLEVVEDPGASTAGFQDLDFGEKILAAATLGDALFVYTDMAIWMGAVDGSGNFVFIRRYHSPRERIGCLMYPFTLASVKASHLYMAKDGIYEWNQYITAPVKLDWIHNASSILYDDLNKSACAIHTAFTRVSNGEVAETYFSVALGTDTLPSVTLVANAEFGKCHKLDHGFTAGCMVKPDDRPSVRDWFVENCIFSEADLDVAELRELGFTSVKEGDAVATTNPTCGTLPNCIYTTTTATNEGFTTEDWEQPAAAATSICNILGGLALADECRDCDGDPTFVAACASDYCLKELTDDVFYRQSYSISLGTYALDGYDSIMLLGPLNFGTEREKTLSGVRLEFTALPQTTPSQMQLFIGASNKCDDPLDTCGIQWYEENAREIVCRDDDKAMDFAAHAVDTNLYLKFLITGTGGGSTYSSLETVLGT